MKKTFEFETRAIQSTHFKDKNAGAVTPPIYLSTTFERNTDGTYPHDYVYSRMGNPNRQLLEKSIVILENGGVALAFSSGMAATTALFQTLKSGDHVLMPDDAYYSSLVLAVDLFGKWGLEMTKVDMSDLTAVEKAIQKNTKIVWLETPSNPQLKISDIAEISKLAHQNGAICAVDNTWATPVFQRPLDLGADVVMHSSTKYFGGHSDVLGGALVLKEASDLTENLRQIQHLAGSVPSPFECWLTLRGIKTLSVRVERQTQNALQLATFLKNHPKIEAVHYPGLDSHPQFEIAKKQMIGGFGAMVSVQPIGDAQHAMAITGKLKLFTTATSLGGVESLIEHRKSIEGETSLTPDNLLRISVGLEHVEDLISDWQQALGQ
ncbi:MAG: aminotransferase class I/II-fold pyridoxal phosphate-dependent enzyme [Bacteroidetes bacterium]|jgi:cystathionine gamma-synthase|nr:aminotransferase class I/II-fold pyridoxal phosphate-dependent enzyme [Bacteroidota bacterium]MDF1864088.1 aminotransferase class I/II-fold pyridoxal phosphate-dependent enzyme [Saprospiraceae bacterium]